MEKIELTGVKNIRDISYGNIKEKKLIRSSELSKLNDKDVHILSSVYKVKNIIDLRSQKEVRKRNDVIIPNAIYHNIPLIDENEFGITFENKLIKIPTKIPNLSDTYVKFVSPDKKDVWNEIFNIISNDNDGAILWHCTAGKDRCGLVSYMIEYCLGLDEETLINDYLYTNNFYQMPKYFKMISHFFINDAKTRFIEIFKAKREYLFSALNYINNNYGNIDVFMNEICGVNEEKKNKIRKLYLK